MTKREAIVAAATQLFSRHGYDATTMDEIAAQAGVAKATLYRYFRTKAALRDEVAAHLPDASLEERDVRARILEVAMTLVSRQGFARTTLDDIAAAAEVSRSAIYWHFKDKDALIAALIAAYTPFPRIAAIVEQAGDRPFEEVARQIYGAAAEVLGSRIDFLSAALPEARTNPELAEIIVRNVLGPLFQSASGLLLRDMSRGDIRAIDPLLALQALFAPLIFHLFTREVLARQLGMHYDLQVVQDTFLDLYFEGLRPRRAAGDATGTAQE